jgi:hypothetical protein
MHINNKNIMFKLNNESFTVVNDESFVFKTLLLLTYATKMFIKYLSRFQQYYFCSNALLNKVFK